MPAKKTTNQKKKAEQTKKEVPQVEILPAETSQPSDPYQLALARADAVSPNSAANLSIWLRASRFRSHAG